jgi:hypothetical protein
MHGAFQAHTPALHNVSSSMRRRSEDLDDLSSQVGSTSVSGHAFGSLGGNAASSSNNHIQHASQAVGHAAQTHRAGADNLRRSASAYEAADERAAQSFHAINSHAPGDTTAPSAGPSNRAGPSNTQTGPYNLRPGTVGAHPWMTNPPRPPGQPPAWGAGGPSKQELDEFGSRWQDYHGRPLRWGDPGALAQRPQHEQDAAAQHDQTIVAQHQANLTDLNQRLRPNGFQITTGHHDFDPVVKPIRGQNADGSLKLGNPTSYQQFADGHGGRPPAGRAEAQELHEWAQGTRPFNQLSPHVKDIAVITHVAENGRGFQHQVGHFDNKVGEIANLPPGQEAEANRRWQALIGRDNPSFVPAGQNVNAEAGYGRPIPANWNRLPQDVQDSRFDNRITTQENRLYDGPPSPVPHEEYDTTPLGPGDHTDPNRFYLPQGYPLPPGVQRPPNTYDSDDEMDG